MDDALLVRGLERLDQLQGHGERFLDRQRPVRNAFGQGRTVDQLHDQRTPAAAVLEAVDGRDVGMVQRRERPRLAFESGRPIGIVADGGREHFEGDVAVKFLVPGAVDLAHATGAEQANDLVRTDKGAG